METELSNRLLLKADLHIYDYLHRKTTPSQRNTLGTLQRQEIKMLPSKG